MPTHEQKMAIFEIKPGSDEHDAIRLKGDSVHKAHPCEHPGCTKDGGWGFGTPSRVGGVTHWFCFEHKDAGVGAHAF